MNQKETTVRNINILVQFTLEHNQKTKQKLSKTRKESGLET